MNYRAGRGLEFRLHRIRFAQELMDIFMFFISISPDFEDFNWPALQEGAVCSWSLYGMDYRLDQVLDFRRDRFRFTQELMEIFRSFISIWPILLILRISTGQPIKKEQSVHEAFIGSIIEQIEGSNSVYTESDLHKNSWIYLCFSFPFLQFCNF